MYYLNSRYYDATIGRFINADSFASTGQGILGHNMFAYCLNNPVSLVDSQGCVPSRWDYEWSNPQNETAAESGDAPGTFSVGVAAFGSPECWTYGGQLCLSVDSNGNTELQYTPAAGLTTGEAGGSVMGYVMITNAPHVSKLRGMGYSVGGTIPTKPAMAYDFNIIPDDSANTTYIGST